MSSNNAVILLKAQTYGEIKKGEALGFVKRPYEFDKLGDGDIVVQTLYLSIDPYIRGKIRDPSIKSYTPAFEVGKSLYGFGVGRIYKSKNPNFKEGQIVAGVLDWAEYTRLSESSGQVDVVDNKYNVPLSLFVGVLSMAGFTAYAGLRHIGHPKKGETIFISAAAGAVGQVVGQLAKQEGLRVVGAAGSDEKVDYLINELGLDAAFNYKKEAPSKALPRLCPKGIDIYWENVGGETLDAVLVNINDFSRIVACGMISTYGKNEPYGVKNLMNIVSRRIRLQGFIQDDFRDKYWHDFLRDVGKLVGEKKIKYKEDITEGLDNAIDAFIGLMEGKNFGKAVVKVTD